MSKKDIVKGILIFLAIVSAVVIAALAAREAPLSKVESSVSPSEYWTQVSNQKIPAFSNTYVATYKDADGKVVVVVIKSNSVAVTQIK